MDATEQKILSILDKRADELQALAQDLYLHAEQGYHEYRTAKVVSDCLKKLGLEPREGLAITGLRAGVGKKEGPNVALIGELDGLNFLPAAAPPCLGAQAEGEASSRHRRSEPGSQMEHLPAALYRCSALRMLRRRL